MRFSFIYPALLSLSAVALGACTAPTAEEDRSTSDISVDPSEDDGVGTLKVAVERAQLGSAKIFARRFNDLGSGNVLELAPNSAKSVPQGKYCVWTRVNGVETFARCGVNVTRGQETVHPLGTVTFTRSTNDLVYGLDYPTSASINPLLALSAPVPHASGTISFGTNPFLTSFEVAVAGTTRVNLNSTTGMNSLRILPSENRALPSSSQSLTARYFREVALVVTDGTRRRPTQPFSDLASPLLFKAPSSASVHVALGFCTEYTDCPQEMLSTREVALTPETTVVQLGRLDVNKERDASTGAVVEGTFDVFLNGKQLTSHYAGPRLGTGVDVLCSPDIGNKPYKVVLHYELSNGLPQEQTREVFVPCE